MKVFFIFMMISVLISIIYLLFYVYNWDYILEATNNMSKKFYIAINIIFPLSSIVIILTFIILTFYLDFLLGVACLIFYVFLSIFLIIEELVGAFIIGWLIFTLLFFWLIPIDKTTPDIKLNEETKQVIELYPSSNDINNNTVIINISEVEDDNVEYYLYAIMEYNPEDVENYEIPSTIKTVDKFKTTKDGDNKLEIVTKTVYSNTVLSYFGFLDPYVDSVETYTLYITEDNVISSNIQPN